MSLSRASDVCKQHGKKTISGDDVIQAISNLGFDEYIEPLQVYLSKYRQVRRHSQFCSIRILDLYIYEMTLTIPPFTFILTLKMLKYLLRAMS